MNLQLNKEKTIHQKNVQLLKHEDFFTLYHCNLNIGQNTTLMTSCWALRNCDD